MTLVSTAGVTHHAILFPFGAATWSNEDIQRAAIHEMEHVRRGDCLLNTLVHLICALYWFHPLAWIASRQLALGSRARQRRCSAASGGRDGVCGSTRHAGRVLGANCKAPLGLWDMQRTTAGDSIVLRLCYAELFSRSEFAVEQLAWWPSSPTSGQQIRFALTREAGTFAFEGTFENNVVTGQFTFEPAIRFEAALRERGQPSLTPSQYLALAQHDIGLAAIDSEAGQRISGAAWLIHIAQTRAQLEELIAKSNSGGVPSPRVC